MKSISGLLIGLLLLVFCTGLVFAVPLIDQEQPIIDTSVGGLAIGGTYQQKLAQVVTAGTSGYLTEVRFLIGCDESSNLSVEVQGVVGGLPDGVVLTSETIPGSNLPHGDAGFRSLAFSIPVYFSAGSQFAIILNSFGTGCGVFRGPVGDSYFGGNLFFDTRPNPPGVWVCVCNFPGDHFDLPFQTLMDADYQPPSIDIKPGTFPNTIHPSSKARLPVAILTRDNFDASTINPATVRFGTTGTEASPVRSAFWDVDGDGDMDLLLQFNTLETGIACGDTSAMLMGETFDGLPFTGVDSIVTTGCK